MALNEDTAALVAAQLTAAWATRIGMADIEDAGKVGPGIMAAYRMFLKELDTDFADIDAQIAALRGSR